MLLIKESTVEAERDITEGNNLLSGTETKTEDTQKKRGTSRFVGTDSGEYLQLAAKKESESGLYKHIWIPGYNNPLRPNTFVNEA